MSESEEPKRSKVRSLDFEKLAELIGKEPSQIVQGGLHLDDFEWALQNEPEGYVLVAFVMEPDNYHWKAVYVKNEGQFP